MTCEEEALEWPLAITANPMVAAAGRSVRSVGDLDSMTKLAIDASRTFFDRIIIRFSFVYQAKRDRHTQVTNSQLGLRQISNKENPPVTGARTASLCLYVVDDDDDVLSALGDYLGRHDFQVETANGGPGLDALLAAGTPDLVVLDVMMPGEDGLAICRRLAALNVPVLLLSALGETIDRVVGLETGAADYLPKPFEPRELLARIRAILRRPQATRGAAVACSTFHFDGWQFEMDEHRLWHPHGGCVALTPGEARLLAALTARPGRLLSRDALINRVRGVDAEVFDRSIDLLVSRLRRKLAENGLNEVIETVRGEGYRFTRDGSTR